MTINRQAEETIRWFNKIYIVGIPTIITDDSAFLSFICIITAIEALSGYRYGDITLEKRFTDFIRVYFPEPYKDYGKDLYLFRNKIVHAFSTGKFALTHNNKPINFKKIDDDRIILNAENLYGALKSASERYFTDLRNDANLTKIFQERLTSFGGGSITVVSITTIIKGP